MQGIQVINHRVTTPPVPGPYSAQLDIAPNGKSGKTDEIMMTYSRTGAAQQWGTGGKFSVAMWVKPTSDQPAVGSDWGPALFGFTDVTGIPAQTAKNYIWIEPFQTTFGNPSSGDWQFDVGIYGTNGSDYIIWNRDYGSTDISSVYTNGLNEWNFVVVTYDDTQVGISDIISVYINGVKQTPNGSSSSGAPITWDPSAGSSPGGAYMQFGSTGVGSGTAFVPIERALARFHRGGLWNKRLSNAEQSELYSGGSVIEWTSDSGSYNGASTLIHYYKFGVDVSAWDVDGAGVSFATAAGGKYAAYPVAGTGQGNSILWDWSQNATGSGGWDLDGLSTPNDTFPTTQGPYPTLVEDGPDASY
jgi:hypothetical protein